MQNMFTVNSFSENVCQKPALLLALWNVISWFIWASDFNFQSFSTTENSLSDMAEKNDVVVLPNKRINSFFFFFIKNGAQGPSELRVLVLCFVAKAYPLKCKLQSALAYMTGVITFTNSY